ncbi:hypothetical protein BSL78_30154 [Apostichopus japonicus]|uniref:Uncharacterized protein n=1 Tax=Stichopus japonicus TaxID=307972 RepID=A0A2G8JBB8_STIJA|nr:hypothetical protein BSL78_30154 [Apostichopus japonicus]
MGKSRVTPLKTVTIPRLELQAAVVSSKVSSILNRELEYEKITNYFWTDSQVVMGYINNDSRRFHVYVANRVQRIRNSTEPHQWNYISTDANPADHASRGLFVQELASSNWFKGPAFLLKRDLEFASCSTDISSEDPEVKTGHVFAVAAAPVGPILDRVGHFSNWAEAVRGISALRGLIRRKRGLAPKSRIKELKDTEIFILKLLQKYHFQNEIHLLETKKPKVKGQLWKLDPYLDEEGVLRVGGRLRRTTMSHNSKHQILVPKKTHITDLLIKHSMRRWHTREEASLPMPYGQMVLDHWFKFCSVFTYLQVHHLQKT